MSQTRPLIYNVNLTGQTLDVTDDTETVVATLTNVTPAQPAQIVKLHGFVNVTSGANASGCVLTIRRESIAGTVVGAQSATDAIAALAQTFEIYVNDPRPEFALGVYVLTITMTGATAHSTVTTVQFDARCD